ncbi:F-box/LRR-repeat protein 13-like [Chenopodium quinoa]|uniref:F-box domain-containing protein n=1 Tax=Chenopodium quinoa TaxID=63459 RepID=A0A803LPA2_CHEQI|nr:F-box/LRR-repeat protein 13-like [Chenopodium quinoa]
MEEDRIRDLPDSLLITILSFLPINTAASTSVLSRRWQYLWTHVNHFSLETAFDNLHTFITSVDHILSKLTSPKIYTFNLQFFLRQSTESSAQLSSCFVPWLHQICRRDPKIINVGFHHSHGFYSSLLFHIPTCVFETRSLIELDLYLPGYIEFKAPTTFINLPNLKKLSLLVCDSYCYLIDTLIKSLPFLEDLKLSMNLTVDVHCFAISASNLKNLFIGMNDWGSKVCRFVIDAPKLEHCEIHGYLAFYEFFTTPIDLQMVLISVEEPSDDEKDDDFDMDYEYYSLILGLLQGISCVRSLVLISYGVDIMSYLNGLDGIDVPIFSNLIDLSLYNDTRPYEGPITRLLLRQQ